MLAEPVSALDPRARVLDGGSSRTNLMARGGCRRRAGPGQWAIPGAVAVRGPAGVAGRRLKRGRGLWRAELSNDCASEEQPASQVWGEGEGESASKTGKCPLTLGGSGPFRARAFAFQLGSCTGSPVSQGAGQCRRGADLGAGGEHSRALSTNQEDLGGPAERDVGGQG